MAALNATKKVALVTGASSGIGKATASMLLDQGWLVYGLSRSGNVSAGVKPVIADISIAESLQEAMRIIWGETQQLDLIVNAAGIGGAGPVETFPIDEAQRIIDTNFMGAFYLAQACLPYLRQQGQGVMVFVSSIAGLMGIPFHGLYAASKFALEGMVESLRYELIGTGVRVSSVCPGDTATPIIGHQYKMAYNSVPKVYEQNYQRADEAMARSVEEGIPPSAVAHHILQIASMSQPKVRYPVGEWLQRSSPLIKRFLPVSFFERIMTRYYGLS